LTCAPKRLILVARLCDSFGGSRRQNQRRKETSHGNGSKRHRAADQGPDPGRRRHHVYEALKGEMGGALHALALQTSVPES
jgi:hypothetical protein